jgi:hypothetical protein
MLTADRVATGRNLLVLDVGFAGLVTGLKRRWREFPLSWIQ